MLVSIIIPVYKNHNYLKYSLSSAINQTYKNIEIIVVNDGDKDDSEITKIIRNQKKRTSIKYFKLDKNYGVSYALNFGIKKSKGDYINWLSHDDYFHKEKIENQISLLKKHDNLICYTAFYQINKKKKRIFRPKIKFFNPKLYILVRDNLNFCTFLINKKIFDKVGYFDESLKHIQDYDMLYRILSIYPPLYLNVPLFYSRIHDWQNSNLLKIDAQKEKEKFFSQKKLFIKNSFLNLNFFYKVIILFFISRRKFNHINHYLINSYKNKFSYFLLKLSLLLFSLINL